MSKYVVDRIRTLDSLEVFQEEILKCLPLVTGDHDSYLDWMEVTVEKAMSTEDSLGEHIQGMVYSAE